MTSTYSTINGQTVNTNTNTNTNKEKEIPVIDAKKQAMKEAVATTRVMRIANVVAPFLGACEVNSVRYGAIAIDHVSTQAGNFFLGLGNACVEGGIRARAVANLHTPGHVIQVQEEAFEFSPRNQKVYADASAKPAARNFAAEVAQVRYERFSARLQAAMEAQEALNNRR